MAESRFVHFCKSDCMQYFLIARIMYVLQVLHCARKNVQKIHRICALFVWKSGSELMRRDNLFRRISVGGIGLPHLYVRQLVSRFFFLRDQEQPFLRTMIQTKLACHFPSFLVSSENLKPMVAVGFLKEVVDSFNFLSARFSREYLSSVNRKDLTRALLDILFPVPIYRTLFADGPGQDVLCRVKTMYIPPAVKTLFFKLHTGTLPVKVWMKQRGMFVPWSVDCLLCKQPESAEHVFIDCWDAVLFWDILKRTLKKDLIITPYYIRFLPVDKHELVPYDLFVLLGLFSIGNPAWLLDTQT